MATTDASGTGVGPIGKHGRRATVVAAVVLAFAAIVVPFAVRGLEGNGAQASPATRVSAPPVAPATHQRPATDPALGGQGNLPALLPSRSKLTPGARVILGNLTDGVLRRTPDGTRQVLVRWNGRLQPVPTRGPVQLAAGAASSWIAEDGLLYTRIPTGTPGRFRVYAWDPRGGSAYTPPALVSTSIGQACFNRAFTAFGNCHTDDVAGES
jgi:hypothetical protein